MRIPSLLILIATLLLSPGCIWAGEANILNVTVEPAGEGGWRLSATVTHADAGWDHYADGWEILDEAGNVIDVRVLAHPHVSEQPFTRSLTTNKIPATVKGVIVRAHCSVHGHGGKQLWVALAP